MFALAPGKTPGGDQKATEMPFEKFELAPSRYHSWKCQVAPTTITPPGGLGRVEGTSKPEPTVEVPPRFWKIPPASKRPIEFKAGPAAGL